MTDIFKICSLDEEGLVFRGDAADKFDVNVNGTEIKIVVHDDVPEGTVVDAGEYIEALYKKLGFERAPFVPPYGTGVRIK